MNWNEIARDCLKNGMTQAELADAIGVSQYTVSVLVNDKQRSVTWETGQRLLATQLMVNSVKL